MVRKPAWFGNGFEPVLKSSVKLEDAKNYPVMDALEHKKGYRVRVLRSCETLTVESARLQQRTQVQPS